MGLRKLREAATLGSGRQLEISWEPFQLRPNTPVEGIPKPAGKRVGAHLKEAGATVGIDFTGLTDRTPNTLLFHATMTDLKSDADTQTAFQKEAFNAYFTRGVFPDKEGLLDCAQRAGVLEKVSALYADEKRLEDLASVATKSVEDSLAMGISGVPFFFINGKPAFSGARDPTDFLPYF